MATGHRHIATRRSNGEGAFTRLKSGTYQLRIGIRFLDGTTKRRTFYGPTEQECKVQAKAAQEGAQGVVNSAGLTVGEWMAGWLTSIRQHKRLKPRTLDFYESYATRYIVPNLGHLPLTGLNSLHIQSWFDGELAAGLGVPTLKHIRSTLRVALTRALQMRLVASNVAANGVIHLPSHTAQPAEKLELSELGGFRDTLLRQASEGRDHFEQAEAVLIFVGLTTGMRNEEIIGLTWDDVQLEPLGSERLHVCRVLQRVKDPSAGVRVHTNGRRIQPKRWEVSTPKSAAGDRWLHLWPEAGTMLRAEQDRQRLAGWTPLDEGDLVFRTKYGKPLSDQYLGDRMKRVCEKSGIPYRSFYALRHTAASVMYHAGESDVSIAEFLGHSDPATTRRIYAHMFKDAKPARMEKTRALLFGLSSGDETLDEAGEPETSGPTTDVEAAVQGVLFRGVRPPFGAPELNETSLSDQPEWEYGKGDSLAAG